MARQKILAKVTKVTVTRISVLGALACRYIAVQPVQSCAQGPLELCKSIEDQVRSWLLRGAVREDDNDGRLLATFGFWLTGDDRDPDPYGFITRG